MDWLIRHALHCDDDHELTEEDVEHVALAAANMLRLRITISSERYCELSAVSQVALLAAHRIVERERRLQRLVEATNPSELLVETMTVDELIEAWVGGE